MKTIEDLLRGTQSGSLEAGKVPVIHPVSGKKIYLPYWQGERTADFAYSLRPCVKKDFEQLQTFVVEQGKEGIRVLKLKLHPDVYKELPNELWRPWKWVLYHDDSPCSGTEAVRLVNGFCPKCKIHPDSQSMCLRAHCPDCDVPLEYEQDRRKDHICSTCKVKFRSPTP